MNNQFKNGLIPLTENKNGETAVSAKELYEFLGFDKSNWAKWYKKNILENDFATEGVDYQLLVLSTSENTRGNFAQDFALSITFAKKIAMMSRTEKGEQARDYFIECEKQLKSQSSYVSPFEAIRDMVDASIRLEKEVREMKIIQQSQDNRLREVESRLESFDEVLPLSDNDVLPEGTLRDKVNFLVHKHAQLVNQTHPQVWKRIYDELYYKYRHKIVLTKEDKAKGISKIAKAEQKGLLNTIHDIISSYFNPNC